MTKSQYPTIIEKSLQSNESHLYEVDIRGIFHWEALDPGDFVLLTSPTPWGKFLTLLNPFYNPPGWPGVLPLGQADDMCITQQTNWNFSCRYLPSGDLEQIYIEYYGEKKITKEEIEVCSAIMLLGWIGEKLAGAKLFSRYANTSPFLMEDLHTYFQGKRVKFCNLSINQLYF